MQLVTFRHGEGERLGALVSCDGETCVLDLNAANPNLPADLLSLLAGGASTLEAAREALAGPLGSTLLLEDVCLLAPLPRPGKILCIGHNYHGHIGIGRTDPPEFPNLFCKTANTIIGPGQPIVIPLVTDQVDYEAELLAVIGRQARRVSEEEARACVAGYTIFNDVSARDYQKRTSQWMLGKSFDTFGPMGPALVTADEVPDPYGLQIELTVNGEAGQRVNTRDMIFSIPYLVAYISQVMTLEPGDVIATGTPAKLPEAPQHFLRPGDVVEITIERLGTLRNPIQSSKE